jgi:hypothetical protein
MSNFNQEDSPRTNYGAMYEEEKKVMKINLKYGCYDNIVEIDDVRHKQKDAGFGLLETICILHCISYEEEYGHTCETCGEWLSSTTYELPDDLRDCIFKLCIND